MELACHTLLGHEEEWQNFCDSQPDSWVHHYGTLHLDPPNNLSFIVTESKKIVAICPLYFENKKINGKEYNVISRFGLSGPGYVIDHAINGEKYIKKIKTQIHTHLNRLSEEHNMAKVSMNFGSHCYQEQKAANWNELTQWNYLDSSFKFILYDLRPDVEILWQNLSKGHRSDIKKHENKYKFNIINRSTSTLKESDIVKALLGVEDFSPNHLKYLYALYQNDKLEIANLDSDGTRLGSAIFLKDKKIVQYHEAQKFGDLKELPVHHLILWEAIKHYQKHGYEAMDLGVFCYSSQLNFITNQKKDNISLFKRGFGGSVLAFYIGEKFLKRDFFEAEFNQRISHYASTLP